MLRFKCNPSYCCAAIAIWTIIQTGLHLYAIIYIMWWRDCNVDESADNMLFLTYFFTRKCENETRHSLEMNRNLVTILNTDAINPLVLIDTLDIMILTYLILDAIWIVSSVALLTGALFDLRGLWALLFYVPWIAIAAINLAVDTFCTIFFGLRIPTEGNIFDWLHFIGINININEIQKLEGDMPSLVNGAASIIMTFVSARGVVIWVINLIVMIYVIRATIRVAKKSPPVNNRDIKRYTSFSAEERIRKWHQFYGSLESRESRKRRSLRDNVFDIEEEVPEPSCSSTNESQTQNKSSGSVPKNMMSPECQKRIERLRLGELRGQLPWSYVDGKHTPEALTPDVVPDRTYVKLSDVGVFESASRF